MTNHLSNDSLLKQPIVEEVNTIDLPQTEMEIEDEDTVLGPALFGVEAVERSLTRIKKTVLMSKQQTTTPATQPNNSGAHQHITTYQHTDSTRATAQIDSPSTTTKNNTNFNQSTEKLLHSRGWDLTRWSSHSLRE